MRKKFETGVSKTDPTVDQYRLNQEPEDKARTGMSNRIQSHWLSSSVDNMSPYRGVSIGSSGSCPQAGLYWQKETKRDFKRCLPHIKRSIR